MLISTELCKPVVDPSIKPLPHISQLFHAQIGGGNAQLLATTLEAVYYSSLQY